VNLPGLQCRRQIQNGGEETMSRIKSLLFLLALAAQVPLASATVTYQVGGCLPKLPTSTTIQGALNASPSPDVVKVCPGTYNEQIKITIPVTLEGIAANNSTQAIIAVPPGGLVVNATDSFGNANAAQVWVDNVNGRVNLTNLTVDGTGNAVTGFNWVVGVFYQNSSGTMNHLTTQNQTGNGRGVGIELNGGSNNPSVTLENSNVQLFDNTALSAGTNSSASELNATIERNYISGMGLSSNGIEFGPGINASVSGNLLTGFLWFGMLIGSGAEGSVSKNILDNGYALGIFTHADGVAVTSNRIYNVFSGVAGDAAGIQMYSSTAPVTDNTILTTAGGAISLECIAEKNVHSNTIAGAVNGLLKVPTGAVTTNAYYNVGTILSGGC
jgi:hypothetical protein